MDKETLRTVLITVAVIWLLYAWFSLFDNSQTTDTDYQIMVNDEWNQGTGVKTTPNVRIEWDTQYIDLTAKWGYSPSKTVAKADIPTVLTVATKASYGCETEITIPSLSRNERLEPTWTKSVQIDAQPAWKVLEWMCGMGMYRFSVSFVK